MEVLRGNKAVARVVPVPAGNTRELGHDRGRMTVPDDFGAPLPEDVSADFGA